VVKGQSVASDRTFFWRINVKDAVREGRWKYYRNGPTRSLFDLSVDEREQADFSTKYPDIMERLSSEFDKWNKQMLPRPSN
jgi:arylsulfatase A-like enzyme